MKGLAKDGKEANTVILKNKNGMSIELMDIGATWLSCKLPNDGRDVLLGVKSMDDFYKYKSAYLGVTAGRYANRIRNGSFTMMVNGGGGTEEKKIIQLSQNEYPNSLHGGICGFGERRWEIVSSSSIILGDDDGVEQKSQNNNDTVIFSLVSEDGDQGYPGSLMVEGRYHLNENNEVSIDYRAKLLNENENSTVVNITNHAYFNLDGVNVINENGILTHQLKIYADYFMPVENGGLPIPTIASSSTTTSKDCDVNNNDDEKKHSVKLLSLDKYPTFDFRFMKTIIKDFLQDEHQKLVHGYDHSFLLNKKVKEEEDSFFHHACELKSSDGQVSMHIKTNQSAIQVYTGNFLKGVLGKYTKDKYENHDGIALETQCLPDSPNWKIDECLLSGENIYRNHTVFSFNF